MIFVASFTALIDSDGTTRDYLFATESFHTGVSGTPASTPAYGRLVQPGNLTRSIASGKRLFGVVEAGYGELVLANADGEFDALAGYGVAGQTVSVYAQDGAASPWDNFPAGFILVYSAQITSIVADGDVLRIRVKEAVEALNKLLCPLFDAVTWDASLEGTPMPVLFGGCYNVTPVLVEAAELIYMVSSRGEVSAHHAKDSGSVIARALTAGVQELDAYADYAALAAATVPIGHYATCTSESLFKLGSTPVGLVTCDAVEYTGSTRVISTADIISDIVDAAGITSKDTAALIDFETWEAANNSQCRVGFFARDTTTTYADALGAICGSVGAWCGFDRDGAFTLHLIEDPAGMTSAVTITEDDLISLRRVTPDDAARGVPFANVVLRYPRNWTPQTSGLAGIVPESVKTEIAETWPRSASFECVQPSTANPLVDVPIVDQFVAAPDFVMDGYGHGRRVTSTGDLEAYVTRGTDEIGALVGVPRDWFDVTLPFAERLFTDVDIGVCVTLSHRRHGLSAGKQFLIVGIRYELSGAPTATLTLWG